MKDTLDEYKSKFDKCLNLVEHGSTEKKRDVAFAMVLEIINARNMWRENRNAILFNLALYAVNDEDIIYNLKIPASSETSTSMDYSAYRNVMLFLSQESLLNIETVRYVHDHMHAQYLKYRGGSSMQDQIYQVDFNGINSMILGECLDALEMGNESQSSRHNALIYFDNKIHNDKKIIQTFIDSVRPYLFEDDIDINPITSAYLKARDHFETINYYALGEFEHNSPEYSLQYELRTALHYSVEQLLKDSGGSNRYLLDNILGKISAILLIGYSPELVLEAQEGYFLPRLERELTACLKKEIDNRKRMESDIYIDHCSAEEFLSLCPDIAQRVLPLVFCNDWDSGYRMAYACSLYEYGDRSDNVVRYYFLSNNKFNDSFFHSVECFETVKNTLEYYIDMQAVSDSYDEIFPLENLLIILREKFNDPGIVEYLDNKWHGENWCKRTITLKNGWRFKFHRAPYIETVRLCIDGSERARDDWYAEFPEQEKWLHKMLMNNPLGSYSVSWVIDFNLYGNQLLKHLINEIVSLDEVIEDSIVQST
jgi:hypothetical protein